MTSRPAETTIISVRADAHRTVAPDSAEVYLHLQGEGTSKRASRDAVDASLRQITGALTVVGGAVEVVEDTTSTAPPLSWRVQSVHSNVDHDNRGRPTGRYETYLSAVITVRDFALLGEVETAIAAVDVADLGGVSWRVDDDNPAWPLVRADAIRSAVARGRDYATAIDGEVVSLEQVSDVGLLADGSDDNIEPAVARGVRFISSASAEVGGGDGLDPVPQRISATIEARLRATVGVLPG